MPRRQSCRRSFRGAVRARINAARLRSELHAQSHSSDPPRQSRDNEGVIWARLLFPLPLLLVTVPFARLTPEATAAFDRYVEQAEERMNSDTVRDPKLRGGEARIEAVDAAHNVNTPGAMIQDWVGTMFIPDATLAQVQSVLRDYAGYKGFYRPKVIESKQLANSGDEYNVLLRLCEKHILTIVLNSTYHIRYEMPDAKRLIVTSHSTHIGEVKDPGKSYTEEVAQGDDSGFLWRLNSYWRFEAADGGVYARCEAISLSRDVPPGLGWMLKGFLESFPKESMVNTLRGTSAAVRNLKTAGSLPSVN